MLLLLLNSSGPKVTFFWIKVGGVWLQATPYVKVSGVWQTSNPFIKVTGTWE
jgi:hypothetical protein